MADNLILNSGSGGSTLATDEDASGYHYQRVKLTDGTADSTTVIASGNGVASGALRVTVASDSTGQVKLAAGSASVGTVGLNAGTAAIGSLTAGTAAIGSVTAAGTVAHSAVGTSVLPILGGSIACNMDGTTLAAVAVSEGDLSYNRCDLDGRQLVNESHPASDSYNLETSAAQTATVAVAQPGAGFSVYITHLFCSAITAQTLWVHDEDDNVLIPLQYFGANTGTVRMNLSANPIKATAVKAVEFTSTAAVAHSILLQYYIAP